MDEVPTVSTQNLIACPFCLAPIDPTAYFCPKCGKKVREKPISTGISAQVVVYLVSIFLTPFSLALTWRYLKNPDPLAKRIGIISLILSLSALLIGIWTSIVFTQSLNQQINSQLNQYQNLGL